GGDREPPHAAEVAARPALPRASCGGSSCQFRPSPPRVPLLRARGVLSGKSCSIRLDPACLLRRLLSLALPLAEPKPARRVFPESEAGMAPRSFWKDYMRLAHVTCRVTMRPASTAQGKIRFHTINRKTGHRVESRYVDSGTGKPVRDQDQRKAYPLSDDELVVLEDSELEAVALESTRTIDIEQFV